VLPPCTPIFFAIFIAREALTKRQIPRYIQEENDSERPVVHHVTNYADSGSSEHNEIERADVFEQPFFATEIIHGNEEPHAQTYRIDQEKFNYCDGRYMNEIIPVQVDHSGLL